VLHYQHTQSQILAVLKVLWLNSSAATFEIRVKRPKEVKRYVWTRLWMKLYFRNILLELYYVFSLCYFSILLNTYSLSLSLLNSTSQPTRIYQEI
jgi:hypothetical protein